MAKPKKTTQKSQTIRYKINGQNSQAVDFQEISLYGPQGNHEVCVTIYPAKLTDASYNPILDGNVALQIKNALVTPSFFPIITRLLIPFKGDFNMELNGTIIDQNKQTVTISVDEIISIGIMAA